MLDKTIHNTMPAFLSSSYHAQAFHPTFFAVFINPFYFARKGIVDAVKAFAPKCSGRCLDIGCGNKEYVRYYTNVTEYIGLEYDQERNKNKNADHFYDGVTFPFENESFDCAVSNEVFEHVFNPQKHLAEIYRVLKSDGILFMTVPFVWDEHEQPYDYARYSSFGLKFLLEEAGFVVLEQRKTVANSSVIFQLLNAYIHKKTLWLRKNAFLDALATCIFNAPWTLLGMLCELFLPSNDDLYLDNVILAMKKAR